MSAMYMLLHAAKYIHYTAFFHYLSFFRAWLRQEDGWKKKFRAYCNSYILPDKIIFFIKLSLWNSFRTTNSSKQTMLTRIELPIKQWMGRKNITSLPAVLIACANHFKATATKEQILRPMIIITTATKVLIDLIASILIQFKLTGRSNKYWSTSRSAKRMQPSRRSVRL